MTCTLYIDSDFNAKSFKRNGSKKLLGVTGMRTDIATIISFRRLQLISAVTLYDELWTPLTSHKNMI